MAGFIGLPPRPNDLARVKPQISFAARIKLEWARLVAY
jgi:hypothetical protein